MSLVVALTLLVAADGPTQYVGSAAEKEARGQGKKLLKELRFDIDTDGRQELLIAESQKGQLRVVVLRATGDEDISGGFERVYEGPAVRAQRVARFEARPMCGTAAKELLAVFEEPSPDEAALTVKILSAAGRGISEIFSQTFFLPASADVTDEVRFGDPGPRFLIEDVDADGAEEIVWYREPQRISLPGRDSAVSLVIGAFRSIFRFEPGEGRYVMVAEKDQVDFLPPKTVADVQASQQIAKIWGTAQPFWATDGDLETSWNLARKTAVSQALTARFDSVTRVSMIRLVPGCGSSEDEWNRHDRLKRFRISFSSGVRFELERGKTELPAQVRALGEFPLAEGFGGQMIVVLAEPQEAGWVKLEVLELEKSTAPKKLQAQELCVSEIGFH